MQYGIGAVVARAAVVAAVVMFSVAAYAADPQGKWETDGGKSHVEIRPCGEALCGTIVWLKEPNDETGQEKVDNKNADPALQKRKILGLALLNNFIKSAEAGVWEAGTIYNPEDGETYKCTMTLLDDQTLKVRGYVGIPLFGKTQIWKRVN